MSVWYSYLWLSADGTPYYAGKGSGLRAFTRSGHKVLRPACSEDILVFPMANESEAFESEKALVELFGRRDLGTGCLSNLSDGGYGGLTPSEYTKNRIRAVLLTRRMMNMPHHTSSHTEETKQRIRETKLLGRDKASEKQREIWMERFLRTVAWG